MLRGESFEVILEVFNGIDTTVKKQESYKSITRIGKAINCYELHLCISGTELI